MIQKTYAISFIVTEKYCASCWYPTFYLFVKLTFLLKFICINYFKADDLYLTHDEVAQFFNKQVPFNILQTVGKHNCTCEPMNLKIGNPHLPGGDYFAPRQKIINNFLILWLMIDDLLIIELITIGHNNHYLPNELTNSTRV